QRTRPRLLISALATGAVAAVSLAVPDSPQLVAVRSAAADESPIYLDPAYSPEERAADLVSRMTLEEKASQMISSKSAAIPRLGVQDDGWWNEVEHGVSRLQLQD